MPVIGECVVGRIDSDPAQIGEQKLGPGMTDAGQGLLPRHLFQMEIPRHT